MKSPYGLVASSLLVGVLAVVLSALVLARPWGTSLDIGGLYDHPYLRNFHGGEYSREHQTDFRWTRPAASLVLPGAGPQAPLTLRIHGDTPGHRISLDGGGGALPVVLRSGWQRVSLLPRANWWSGDVRVQVTAPEQANALDERVRGVVLSRVVLNGRGGHPPPGQAVLVGLSAALAVLLAGWVFRWAWVGILAGVILTSVCVAALGLHGGAGRLALTDYTGRLVVVLAAGALLARGVEGGLSRLSRRGLVALGAGTRRALAAAALVAFLLRFGEMAYPLNFISDIRFSMARASMVREGEFLELFLPNPALTPVQWETDATIPRSPFYYVLTAPLTALPGDTDRLAMMAFSSGVDALAVVLVGLLVLGVGGSGRAAVLAALLAGVQSLGVLAAMSWGIFPTLLAQALVLLAMVVWVRGRPHLHRRGAWGLFTAVLALAYLAYPSALLFLGLTWGILVVLLALRRDPSALPTFRAGVVAGILALLLFYGWHLPALVGETFPLLLERLSDKAPGGGALSLSLGPLLNPAWVPLRDKYGFLLLGPAVGGAALLASAHLGSRPLTHSGATKGKGAGSGVPLLLLAWCLSYPLLALMNTYVVTFILKHVLYLLPALAVLAGLFLGRLSRCRWGGVVAAVVVALVFWEGVVAELDAIVHAFYQLK